MLFLVERKLHWLNIKLYLGEQMGILSDFIEIAGLVVCVWENVRRGGFSGVQQMGSGGGIEWFLKSVRSTEVMVSVSRDGNLINKLNVIQRI